MAAKVERAHIDHRLTLEKALVALYVLFCPADEKKVFLVFGSGQIDSSKYLRLYNHDASTAVLIKPIFLRIAT